VLHIYIYDISRLRVNLIILAAKALNLKEQENTSVMRYESADTVFGPELCQDFTAVSLHESGQRDCPHATSYQHFD